MPLEVLPTGELMEIPTYEELVKMFREMLWGKEDEE